MADAMTYLNNGLAVVALVALSFAFYRAGQWFGKNVLLPMKDAALNHLSEVSDTMKNNAQVNSKICETMQNIHNDVKEIKHHGCAYRFDRVVRDKNKDDQ